MHEEEGFAHTREINNGYETDEENVKEDVDRVDELPNFWLEDRGFLKAFVP